MKLRGGRWTEIQRRIRENEEGRGMRGRETTVYQLIVWNMELIHMGLHLLTITTFVPCATRNASQMGSCTSCSGAQK